MREAGIYSTGYYVPENIITNEMIDSKLAGTNSPAAQYKRSDLGIKESRFVSKGEVATDLAYKASLKAIENAGISKDEVEFIVYCSTTPDHVGSLDGYKLQDKLGIKGAASITMVGGCSGFVYALTVASKFVKDGTYDTVLVVSGEVVSVAGGMEVDGTGVERTGGINAGDGAGAVILKPLKEGRKGIEASSMGGDGSGYDVLIMPAGGMKLPTSHETVTKDLHVAHFNDKKFSMTDNKNDTISQLMAFSISAFTKALDELLDKTDQCLEDIDWFIPHQPSLPVLNMLFSRYGIDIEKVVLNIERFACPWSATVPISLAVGDEASLFTKNQKLILIAFGGGLAYAGLTLCWNNKDDFLLTEKILSGGVYE